MAGGDISITGQGTTTSSFQGLILAEGSFKAKDTTLIGSALTLDKNGSVQLERVRTVAARDLTKIDLNYPVELKNAVSSNVGAAGLQGMGATEVYGVLYAGSFYPLLPNNYQSLEQLGSKVAEDGSSAKVVLKNDDGSYTEVSLANLSSIPKEFRGPGNKALGGWTAFENQVKTNSVKYLDVFQLDFNKFLKTKGGLHPLLQRVGAL